MRHISGQTWGNHRAILIAGTLLAAGISFNGLAFAEDDAGYRAYAYHVVATEDTVMNLTWRMPCPPPDQCAAHSFLKDPRPNTWHRHMSNHGGVNLTASVHTLVGSAVVPIVDFGHEPSTIGVRVNWDVAEAGDLWFFVLSTHPGVVVEERFTDVDSVSVSRATEAHMYRISELPGIVGARVGLAGAAAGSNLRWEAVQGSYGFSMPTMMPTVAYQRSGETGEYSCPADITCSDDFWGPPGEYQMRYGALAHDWDVYVAGWVDMPIP